jgi:hypothetical protein
MVELYQGLGMIGIGQGLRLLLLGCALSISAPRGSHHPTHGYAATREVAMAGVREELAAGMNQNDVRFRVRVQWSNGHCNTARSLSAGVSKPKALRGC